VRGNGRPDGHRELLYKVLKWDIQFVQDGEDTIVGRAKHTGEDMRRSNPAVMPERGFVARVG